MHRIELTEGRANNKKHFFISVCHPLQDQSNPELANTSTHQNVLLLSDVGASSSVSEQTKCQGDTTLQGKDVGMSQSNTGLFLPPSTGVGPVRGYLMRCSPCPSSIDIPELELELPEVTPVSLVPSLPLQFRLVFMQPRLWASLGAYVYKSFDVTSKATTIDWEGYGLKIQILDDSIPHYLTTVSLDVSLHYINNHPYSPVPPGNHTPFSCSALYCIKVGSGKLCKPVTIEIQHCSNSEPEQLTFQRASSEGEYFRPVTDAVFDQRTNCGRVIVPKLDFTEDQEYNDFSWFTITMRLIFFRNTIHYKAQVYTSKATTMMHFIVTMALDLCSTVSCG